MRFYSSAAAAEGAGYRPCLRCHPERAPGLSSVDAAAQSRYGLSPRSLRGPVDAARGLRCQLDFRPPLAWNSLLGYLRLRAIPGVEFVDGTHYRRTAAIDDHQGWIAVSLAKSGLALDVEMSQSLAPVIGSVIVRVKQLFDLGAAPDAVSALLSQDPMLCDSVRRLPGLRVPGAFDGFELGVRAVLGQQVSVKAATTVAGRWTCACGAEIVTPFPELNRLTPTARQLAGVSAGQIASLGIVGSRARCIAALVQAVNERKVVLACTADVERQIDALMQVPGIGPWTAQYIAMRALHWPDAFPGTDLMLLRAAKISHRQLHARAEAWRPWRAYATHYLWQSLGVIP
jgi:AraC family transcriptional regulator of adaptative response / DNA-3-methyladenine glycosylase II